MIIACAFAQTGRDYAAFHRPMEHPVRVEPENGIVRFERPDSVFTSIASGGRWRYQYRIYVARIGE